MATARLKIESGELAGREFELSRELVIGRAKNCDLVLNDESCSRLHVRLAPDGTNCRVEDLNSTNGTFLNGERVSNGSARDGDAILVGGTTLRFLLPRFDSSSTVVIAGAARDGAKVAQDVELDPPPVPKDPALVAQSLTALEQLIEAVRGTPDRLLAATTLAEHLRRSVAGERAFIALYRAGADSPQSATIVAVPEMHVDLERPWVLRALSKRRALLLEDAADKKSSLSAIVVPIGRGAQGRMLAYVDRRKTAFTADHLAVVARLAAAGQSLVAWAEAVERSRVELTDLKSKIESDRRIVGESPALQEVVNAVRRASAGAHPVLFTGESGTGKELFARLLHDLSPRARAPFVTINCSALPPHQLEQEIVGDRGGIDNGAGPATALERARGGTLFLDEIDAMDLPTQARLASRLKDRRENDVRLAAATDRDLSSQAKDGAFHEDLLALLGIGTIGVPPLRERKEDIPLLADHFLKLHARRMNRRARRVTPDALKRLLSYAWPGNVRELSNVIERATVLSKGEELKGELFPFTSDVPTDPAELRLEAMEKRTIAAALRYCGWKKGKAAELLGISWPTLNKKIGEYGIEAE